MAESSSPEKSRHAPQKEYGREILCDLPPVRPRLVRPTILMSRINGKKKNNEQYIRTGTAVCTGTVCMQSHQSTDQPGKIAEPARVQLNRENEYFLVLVHA